ncbi:UAP56-interacting factor [Myotis brandtii]|uniref:UAP56-interacting factor n=1 Tax=Myotis brandtii TaxID=109478 RepID=S7PME4_MYOBR|nr:UAP56-interacting factor [Myotis brandtii]
MNRFGTRLVGATAIPPPPPPKPRSNENLDKIDMSLDDIIKLNRKEGKKQNFPRLNRRLQQSGARQFRMRVRWGIQQNSANQSDCMQINATKMAPAATELKQAGGLVARAMEEAKLPPCSEPAVASAHGNKVPIIEDK